MLLVFYVCLYSAVRSEHPCGNSAILTFKLASACDSLNSAEVIDRRGGICSSLLSWLLSWQTAMQWHIPPKYDGRQKLPAGRRVLTMQQIVASIRLCPGSQAPEWPMNQSAHGTVWQRNQRTIHQRTSVDTISPLYILSSEHFDFQGCPLIFPSILALFDFTKLPQPDKSFLRLCCKFQLSRRGKWQRKEEARYFK